MRSSTKSVPLALDCYAVGGYSQNTRTVEPEVIHSLMIRVILSSEDLKLEALLAPALGQDFQVVSEPDWEKLRQLACDGSFDVLLLDLAAASCEIDERMQLFEEVNAAGLGVVILTDDASRAAAVDLEHRGAHGYCRKPLALRELTTMLRRASEYAAMKRKLAGNLARTSTELEPAEPLQCDGLIGSSAEMRNVYDLIRRVASLNASVLITGESGTGKELIARAIHNLGERSKSPFIAVSCGAIPETLVESELFGHEKGAFTGTTGTRTGYFEQAGNCTLFIARSGNSAFRLRSSYCGYCKNESS